MVLRSLMLPNATAPGPVYVDHVVVRGLPMGELAEPLRVAEAGSVIV